jgi:hypothetical protein
MTEDEWLACDDPTLTLTALRVPTQQTPLPERKSRLFGLACCERIRRLITDPRSSSALEILAKYAEGTATLEELGEVFDPALDVTTELMARDYGNLAAFVHAAYAVSEVCHPDELAEAVAGQAASAAKCAGLLDETRFQVALVHDIFGNPLRPVLFSHAWRTDTALSLARMIYDSRDFSPMPILADALQDAGCTNDNVLNHCRGPGPHVRGCWVVDLVLGKE